MPKNTPDAKPTNLTGQNTPTEHGSDTRIEKMIEEATNLTNKVQALENEVKEANKKIIEMSHSVTFFMNNVASMFDHKKLISKPEMIYTESDQINSLTNIFPTLFDLKFLQLKIEQQNLQHQVKFLMGQSLEAQTKK